MNRGPDSWRVVLFTLYANVVPVYEQVLSVHGHRLVALFTAPGPRVRRTEDYRAVAQLSRPNLDVVVSNQPRRWAALLDVYRPDLLVCVGYNWKLPQDVLDVPRLGAINLHAALLPKYRGAHSFAWALRNADPIVGWTMHYMTAELDDGPILAQPSMQLTDDDDIDSLWDPYWALAPQALEIALARVAAGDPGDAQNHKEASQADAFEPEWLHIDWSKNARDIHIQVRSWWGNRGETRGALAEIDGVRTRIIKTRLTTVDSQTDAPPGTILSRNNGTLIVQCGDRALEVLRWNPEPANEWSVE